jgi:predicted DNA-binding transcriptional regulator AlpA
MSETFLDAKQVMQRYGFKTKQQVYSLAKSGFLPPPLKVGLRSIRFIEAEVEQHIADLKAARFAAAGARGATPVAAVDV